MSVTSTYSTAIVYLGKISRSLLGQEGIKFEYMRPDQKTLAIVNIMRTVCTALM